MPRTDRRTFLRTGLLGLGAGLVGPSAFLRLARAQPLEGHESVLVVLQLSGGNDGMSMVIPHGDDTYHKVRRQTRHDPKDVWQLSDYVGLHPNLKALRGLYDKGDLAVIQGASYPNPNRSHFKSMDIWHAADEEGRRAGSGWLGRAMDMLYPSGDDPDLLAAIGGREEVPFAVSGRVNRPVAFSTPAQYRWRGGAEEKEAFEALNCECEKPTEDNLAFLHRLAERARASSDRMREAADGYRAKVKYPRSPLSQTLGLVCGLIAGRLPTRVYYVSFGGFDTHTGQKNRHDRLMLDLGDSLAAFTADLEAHGVADRVSVLTFSEFGRRVKENASGGTDHGVAGPMLMLGPKVKGGLHGRYPSLTDLDKGDLKMTVDFRQVYASVLDDWFRVDSKKVLGERFERLPLFGADATSKRA